MVKAVTSQIFSSTYRDDFKDSDNYHRILFNSGRALQARELTQSQTIMQREIARLGRHIFKEGAAINPGGITVNNAYEFIKLDTSVHALPAVPSDLVGVVFTASTIAISFKVLEVVPAAGTDPATLFVAYTNTSSGTSGTSPVRVTAGEEITSGGSEGYFLDIQSTDTVSNPAVGVGTRVSVHAGDFFAADHFVFAKEQSLIIDKYSGFPTAKVGFLVTEDVVTSSDDNALFDNQGATPNLASPGADRYRINLTLIRGDNVDSDQTFIEIANIDDGLLITQIQSNDGYNKIGEVLALRTKEESGDYIVKPFELLFETNEEDNTLLDFNLSPGFAYVDGYRVGSTGETIISVPKPRSTSLENNQVVAASYGNYIVVSSTNKSIPNIDEFELMNLRSAVTHGGSTIGTARVRHVEEDGANYRLYLAEVTMNSGSEFRLVRSIGQSTTNFWNLVLETANAKRKDTSNNSLLFELPKSRPQSLSDVSLTVQRRFVTSTNSSGNASITLTATDENFADTTLWVMGGHNLAVDTGAAVSNSAAGSQLAQITGATASQGTYEILAYVNKSAGVIRAKTLTSRTQTITAESDGTVILDKADIYSFNVIKATNTNGDDISSSYETDNGQRDEKYGLGKLNLIAGNSITTTVYVEYQYFEHSASGDFFAVNSYTGQINYEDIPTYTREDGEIINLRNFLDFRPVVNSSGTFGSGAIISELPRPTSLVNMDVNYYMGQSAKVVIDTTGQISVLPGEASTVPQLPKSPENSMDLFNVTMNPYVVDDNDVKSEMLTYKRFTMADIGRLERRVSDLEEVTALSLLELETSQFGVYDSDGRNRSKSGFFVDNFKDQSRSFVTGFDYKSAIDPAENKMRPSFTNRNVSLFYDSDHSDNSNVISKGDNIMLSYNEIDYLGNPEKTGTENINPFAVVLRKGFMELSPASDEWFDTEYAEPIVVDGGFVQGKVQGKIWDDWSFNWSGKKVNKLEVGDTLGTDAGGSYQNYDGTFQNISSVNVAGISTSTSFIDEEGVELSRAFIPYMRSRKISFKAQGLKPNTQHFPFFGAKSVTDWVKQGTFSNKISQDEDYSTGYGKITGHPDTATSELITDGDGKLEGTFFLPNTNNIKFSSGDKTFTLIDINKNSVGDCTSYASSKYYAQGVIVHRQQTVLSTQIVDLVVASETKLVGPPLARPSRPDSSSSTGSTVSSLVPTNSSRPPLRPPAVCYDTGFSNFTTPPSYPNYGPPSTSSVTPAKGAGGCFYGDPLAQSFLVVESTGVFITSVDVRFKTKPGVNGQPVVMQLRPMFNGVPSSTEIVPGSTVFKTRSNITTSNDASAITTFTLDQPVYLTGRTEFCIVLISDSNEYNVYVAEAGAKKLGEEAKLTTQATLGSLFKSQNSHTWEPDQTKDLTFNLKRADFDTSGSVILENSSPPNVDLTNSIRTTANSVAVEVYLLAHGFNTSDKVLITGADAVGGIPTNKLNNVEHTITAVDSNHFRFNANVTANTVTNDVGGGDFTIERQNLFETMVIKVENILPPATSIDTSAKLTSGSSISGTETRYAKEASYTAYPLNRNIYFDTPKLLATKRNADFQITGTETRSATVKVNLKSATSFVSPVIDMQRTSLAMIHNQIDNNNALDSVNETSARGGTTLAKHLTKPVTLAEEAKGLKIMLSANKPSTASFDMYYRTSLGGTNLLDQDFIPIDPENNIAGDDNPRILRDYRYLAGGIGGDLPGFDQFQIKIVMKSTNTAKVPSFGDLRIIALTV
ncbi:MAG: DUF4815 domain-containing protein [Euryarchaeota archaeon]|nr:DUF4815 domain-containing protein [Euryarchaeota archaeon]